MTQLPIQQAFDAALQHHQAGRLREAEQLYQQILAQQPDHFDAIRNLAMLSRQAGRNDIALDLNRRAIAVRPDSAEAHNDLAIALASQGQLDEAIAAFRRAVALNPSYAEANNNLANVLISKGEFQEAIAACRRAIALRPNYPQAHNNLGIALASTGQLDDAIAAYRQCISLRPDLAEAHLNLGNALNQSGHPEQAIASYRQAIALRPNFPEAHMQLGHALADIGDLDEAIAADRRAIALRPNYPEAHGNLGNALKDAGQLDEAIAAYRQAIDESPDIPTARSNLIMAMHYHPGFDAGTIAQELRLWNRTHAEPLHKFIQPCSNDRDPDRPLRIGYVSPDFKNHPVSHNLLALLDHHDRRQFQITCYAQVLRPDAVTRRLQQKADAWRTIVGISDEEAAQQIRQDHIDILVDLALHTGGNRLLVFARKPAPVQVTYVGYPGSTGMTTIDYRLSDPYLDPPGSDESSYSEKTLRLPRTYWFYPLHEQSPPLPPPRPRAPGEVTFGCLNNFCKVSTHALDLWIQLLRALPKSNLILHAQEGNHRQRIRALLEHNGIDPQRMTFSGKISSADYMSLYEQIDIALDPFPFGGGTTTCDASWMGVPVVTLSGQTAVGRGGRSILSNLGLTDLIAFTPNQYLQIALDLANDPARLDSLHQTLRPRMQASPLMDAQGFARDIESAYRHMWKTWCQAALVR